MTLIINLTPDEEATLRRRAAEKGQNADTLARNAVLEMLRQDEPAPDEDLPAPGESLYDALKGYIGMFHGGEETNWSENSGEKFTDYVVEKHRQGRL